MGFNNGERNYSGTLMLSETPSIAFRNNIVDIELRPYYNYQQTRNSIQTDNRDIHSYGGSLNANYYTPFGLSIGSDITYSATSGYSAGYDNNQWLWNASLSYEFLKDKSATIALKAYDLLHQNLAVHLKRLHIPPSVSNEPNRVGEQPWQWQYMALCFGLSLLGAILITLLIEKPCAWALKKLFTRKQKA